LLRLELRAHAAGDAGGHGRLAPAIANSDRRVGSAAKRVTVPRGVTLRLWVVHDSACDGARRRALQNPCCAATASLRTRPDTPPKHRRAQLADGWTLRGVTVPPPPLACHRLHNSFASRVPSSLPLRVASADCVELAAATARHYGWSVLESAVAGPGWFGR